MLSHLHHCNTALRLTHALCPFFLQAGGGGPVRPALLHTRLQLHDLPAMEAYIQSGKGGKEGAMEAARAQHQLEQAQAERRAAVAALLAAEQLPAGYTHRVPSVFSYIQSSEGSEEGAMAAARAHHQEQLPRLLRDARVVELLTASMLPPD